MKTYTEDEVAEVVVVVVVVVLVFAASMGWLP